MSMQLNKSDATILPATVLPPTRSGLGELLSWRRAGRVPIAAFVVAGILLLAAILGDVIAPHSVTGANFRSSMLPPAWQQAGKAAYVLGTDQLGRDILSRLIAGARVSLIAAGVAIFVGGTIGALIGLMAGYLGGVFGAVIMRIVDAFLALPFILMALAFVAALGSGVGNIVLVLIFTNWARYARIMESEAKSIKERDYVTLARVAGLSPFRIAVRHVLPNAMNSIAVLAVLDIGRVIILEASLSFLGLGVQPPDVSWGLMLADGREYMGHAWWMTTLPGLAIILSVLSFNSIGEWLKLRLDPRGTL